ncbi:hypothetical protein [Pseudoprimorskyibacter insulae]|uniref:Uncharacterized protein n=1 Tax=Pseudoprimorskyibacter insulae TaxID=1695997 RepID=A0A2R8AWX0_9RHOB|nr:hypothetical protein [Pseudoprimorskyibacter insulae]SPF80541.1 hypothetical protein PRI8871_02351 [Pseudoprimorskyibacter insulae]
MADLKDAILDARYIDMISLADFVVRDCGLPERGQDGGMLPQANEIAAAIFRWAAEVEAFDDKAASVLPDTDDDEYDEYGDPLMDADDAEARKVDAMTNKADGSQDGDA